MDEEKTVHVAGRLQLIDRRRRPLPQPRRNRSKIRRIYY